MMGMKNLRRLAAATALLLSVPALAGCQELTDIGLAAAESAAKSEQGQAAKADLSSKGCDWMREQVNPENWDTYQKATGSCTGGTGSTGSGTVVAADPAAVAAATTALASITIADETRASEYSGKREKLFGSAWPDLDRDGCDERQTLLATSMTGVEKDKNGCTVLRGTLDDPYTGTVINFAHNKVGGDSAAVQIDHIVPLSESWASGAHSWDQNTRIAFANDPANLVASDGPANEKKGDKDLGQWIVPATPDYRCTYTTQFVNLKAAYGLSMDKTEHAAATKMLAQCA